MRVSVPVNRNPRRRECSVEGWVRVGPNLPPHAIVRAIISFYSMMRGVPKITSSRFAFALHSEP